MPAIAADNFGGNNKSEGYTNMVDLSGIVEAGAKYSENALDMIICRTENIFTDS